jgi:ribosomal protein L11
MIWQMMMQAAQSGMSPQQFFQQYAGNPEVAQISKIAQGKNREQLMQTASNMAKERGTSLETIAQQMGIPYR